VTALSIVAVKRLELRFAPVRWAFAEERRAEIDAHFAELQRARPALWNGRVLLMHQWNLADDVFRGAYLQTDFASFIAWRDWGFSDPSVRNSFSMAALQGADGAFVLGVMGAHTANAGKIYFPCGTPDPNDIAGDRVDLDRSVRRELAEETGLDASALKAAPGWTTVFAGLRIAQIKVLRSDQTAAELRARIMDHLRQERQPELADIRIVRGPADLEPMMPDFVIAFLRHRWGGAGQAALAEPESLPLQGSSSGVSRD
jgi:8-oxo-dGTP pyrophosphatase MutT (NUDIX family)